MKVNLLLLAGALALTSCATSPVGRGEASAGHAIVNPWQTPGPDTGRLIVNRDSGFMGAACAQRIYVDGTPIGSLRSSQGVMVYLPPGEHVVGVRSTGICGGGSASAPLVTATGGTKTFRVASGQSGDIKIEPSAF